MKVTNYDGADERKTMAAMITDRTVLGMVSQHWKGDGLFSTKHMNLIGGWCVEHLRKHNEAPGKLIADYFTRWGQYHPDKHAVQAVEDLLAAAAAEHRSRPADVPSDHAVEVAGRAFRLASLTKLKEQLERDLETGQLDRADRLVQEHTRVELGAEEFSDPLQDVERTRKAHTESRELLVEYPGALGEFFGQALRRGNFVTLVGREKIGKSWVLQDIAWRGLSQRRRVCYFQIGDLSEEQQYRRFDVRAAGIPEDPQTCRVPMSLEAHGDSYVVVHEDRVFEEGLNHHQAMEAKREFIQDHVKSTKPYLQLTCLASDSVDMRGVRERVDQLRHRGWHPDIICIDYLDLVDPPPGLKDAREKINSVWKAARRLALKPHCLVVTVTQCNRAGYDVEWLTMKNIGEEKRKLSHCSHAVGLNQTEAEEADGVMRFNWLVNRTARKKSRWPYVAGCLALAAPCMLSAF